MELSNMPQPPMYAPPKLGIWERWKLKNVLSAYKKREFERIKNYNKRREVVVKSIVQMMQMFDIEDDDGKPVTEKTLMELDIEKLIEVLDSCINNMEELVK